MFELFKRHLQFAAWVAHCAVRLCAVRLCAVCRCAAWLLHSRCATRRHASHCCAVRGRTAHACLSCEFAACVAGEGEGLTLALCAGAECWCVIGRLLLVRSVAWQLAGGWSVCCGLLLFLLVCRRGVVGRLAAVILVGLCNLLVILVGRCCLLVLAVGSSAG